MKIQLPFDRRVLDADLPEGSTVLSPKPAPPVMEPERAVRASLRAPIDSRPLQELVRPGQGVVIVTSDITRPVPNRLLLWALIEELRQAGIQDGNVTILNGTGLHKPNSEAELDWMYGREILDGFRIIQHDARQTDSLTEAGRTTAGVSAMLCSEYVDADFRIVTGFVEPHLFAGFSGGAKGVMPGVAGADLVSQNHGFRHLAHAGARWCNANGNPVFDQIREVTSLCPPQFLLNVTLDPERRVTGVFAGDYLTAHDAAIEQAREQYVVEVPGPFDVVVTTNMGYPADANLYQSVKGMSVAAEAVSQGGSIILVAGCVEGLGSDDYVRLLDTGSSAAELLARMAERSDVELDQWQIQCQAAVQKKARVFLHSMLSAEETARAHLDLCTDVGQKADQLVQEARSQGRRGSFLVMPHGQMTVPVIA